MDSNSKVNPTQGQGKDIISWNNYLILIDKLYDQVKDKGYLSISGIPRGGLIIAVILSHKLGIPFYQGTSINYKTLLVDDIADSGNTLIELNPKQDVAVLHLRSTSKYRPKYYVEEIKNDNWQIYPYERN